MRGAVQREQVNNIGARCSRTRKTASLGGISGTHDGKVSEYTWRSRFHGKRRLHENDVHVQNGSLQLIAE